MKSFALHLVVVFIIGTEFPRLQTFCSSTPTSSPTTSSSLLSLPSSSAAASLSSIKTLHSANGQPTTSSFVPRFIPRATTSGPYGGPNAATTKLQTGGKTPRTIQRLMGGHIQHKTSSNSNQFPKAYFRRKPDSLNVKLQKQVNFTVLRPVKVKTSPPIDENDELDYKDTALLEDETNDISGWDGGILRLSAGAGKETTMKIKKKDDSKKTLSDQVKDGKYGLIENELFQNVPKRPGVISYLANKEVPEDNAKNYGGLKEKEIWLAEDHLLVLKGGSLNTDDTDEPWTPIDDYQAPGRQIQIPHNPKVPPPFPVQFEDNGPIQFIGNSKFPFFYSKDANESFSPFSEKGYASLQGNGNDEKNLLTGPRPSQNATGDKDSYIYPPAYPPWLFNNESFKNPFLNFAPPPQNPLPFDNGADYIDEDDPSLYYPPPYTFIYKSNYTNPVKPGPLVPGIVLPPPPNAFIQLEGPSQRKPSNAISFSDVLNKITEGVPKIVQTTTTTPTTRPRPTTQLTPVKNKEAYFVRPRPRPTSTSSLPPMTTTTTSTTSTTSAPASPRPEIISFVPQGPATAGPLANGNPIYYEYFDAKKVPLSTTTALQQPQHQTQRPHPTPVSLPNIRYPTPPSPTLLTPPPSPISFPVSLAPLPRPSRPNTLFPTSIFRDTTPLTRRPNPTFQTQKPLRINSVTSPPKSYNYNEYLYITPKPEIYPNGISSNIIPQQPHHQQQFKSQPDFDREVNAIHQTLQYYKSQQDLRQNFLSRNPKAKSFYEYAYGETLPPLENFPSNTAFTPPTSFDSEPFKPMVSYSRPVEDANGFKAIAYPRTDNIEVRLGDNLNNRPAQQSIDYTGRDERTFTRKPPQPTAAYASVQSTFQPKQPWVSIEKQIVHELNPQQGGNGYRQADEKKIDSGHTIHQGFRGQQQPQQQHQQQPQRFSGYNYTQPQLQRTNHHIQQFIGQPFSKQIGSIHAQLSQYQQQNNEDPAISLENDTYINTLPGRTINPDAEYIDLNAPRSKQFQQQRYQAAQQQSPGNDIYRKPVDLGRDELVNYNLPLPPINPDSEYIQPQFGNKNSQQLQSQQQQRFEGYNYTQQQAQRTNHRFQQFVDRPFSKQIGSIRAQLSQYQQQRNEDPAISLENDTYINTLPGRTINPDAEYIDLNAARPKQFQQQRYQAAQQQSPGSDIYRKPVDLGRDEQVNYNLPLPSINPDSEYIQPQFGNKNPQQQQLQHQQQPQRFEGYYYTQPRPQLTNHRFQPFSKQIGSIRAQLSQYQQPRNDDQAISLENDTYINTLPGRTINPDAEYIDLNAPRAKQFQQQRYQAAQQQSPGNDVYRKPVNLERDVFTNFNLPLPPVIPFSEYILPQVADRNPVLQQQQNFYQRPQYSNHKGGPNGPITASSRPPNIFYVKPQRDLRYKGV